MADPTEILLKVSADGAELKRLAAEFANVQKSVNVVTDSAKKLGTELQSPAAMEGVKKLAAGMQALTQVVQRNTQAVGVLANDNKKLAMSLEGVKNSVAWQAAEIKRLGAEMEKLRGYLGSATVGLVRLSDAHRQATTAAGQQANQQEKTAQSADKATSSFGMLRAIVYSTAAVLGFQMAQALGQADMDLTRINNTLLAITGSSTLAKEEFTFISTEAKRLGADLMPLAQGYAKFSASTSAAGVSTEETRKIFIGFTEAATVMGLSGVELNGIFLALGQMFSKGKVSAEELRLQLAERLPGAVALSAMALGVTTAEMSKMLENGEILATDLVPKLSVLIQERFGAALPQALDSTNAAIGRMNTSWFEFKNAVNDSGFRSAYQATVEAISFGLDTIREKLGLGEESARNFFKSFLLSGGSSLIGDAILARMQVAETAEALRLTQERIAAANNKAPGGAASTNEDAQAGVARRAQVTELISRAKKLEDTSAKYRDALIEAKDDMAEIAAIEARIAEIRQIQAKPLSLEGVGPEKTAAVLAGWTQQQLEYDIEILERKKDIAAIEARRARDAKQIADETERENKAKKTEEERVSKAQRDLMTDEDALSALVKRIDEVKRLGASELDILELLKEREAIEKRIETSKKRQADDADRLAAAILQTQADSRERAMAAGIAQINGSPFMTERQKRAALTGVYQQEAAALPGLISAADTSRQAALAAGQDDQATFYLREGKRLRDRKEVGNPADLKSNEQLGVYDQILAKVVQIQDSFVTIADTVGNVLTAAMDGLATSVQGLLQGTMSWGDALQNIAQTVLTSLIQSVSRLFSEWLVGMLLKATVGKALQTAALAATAPIAAATAAMWATPATLATIASFGSAAALAPGQVAGSLAATQALALFRDGGFTQSGNTGKIVGGVHEDEWVAPKWMVKDPTIGPQIAHLESMRVNSGVSKTTSLSAARSGAVGSGGSPSGNSEGGGVSIAFFPDREAATSWLKTRTGKRILHQTVSDGREDRGVET